MIGEVSGLRQEQAAVEAELAAKQEELDRATRKLEADTAPPGQGSSSPAASARGPARAPRRDLRVGQPRHGQRRPRIGELVGSECSGRLPEPDPGTTTTRSRPGEEPPRPGTCRRSPDDRDAAPDQAGPRRDRGQGARSRRGPGRGGPALRRAQGSSGGTAGRPRKARVPLPGPGRQPRRDLRTDLEQRLPGPGDTGAAHPGAERRIHLGKPGERALLGAISGAGGDRSRQRDRHDPLRLGRRPRLLRILRLRLLGRGQLRPAWRRLPRKPARLDRAGDLGRSRRRASGSPSTPTPATPG